MNESRDRCKKAAYIAILLLHLVTAFVVGYGIAAVGYGIAKKRGDKRAGKAMLDVYRCKTTLEITYRDSVAIDSTVVYKAR